MLLAYFFDRQKFSNFLSLQASSIVSLFARSVAGFWPDDTNLIKQLQRKLTKSFDFARNYDKVAPADWFLDNKIFNDTVRLEKCARTGREFELL